MFKRLPTATVFGFAQVKSLPDLLTVTLGDRTVSPYARDGITKFGGAHFNHILYFTVSPIPRLVVPRAFCLDPAVPQLSARLQLTQRQAC
jgi:hypothetical protein